MRKLVHKLMSGIALGLAAVMAIADSSGLYIVQDKAWAPLAFTDEQGQPQGLLIDLWQLAAEKSDLTLVVELVDWPQTLRLVSNSDYQVHGGLFRSPERLGYLDFSDPLISLRATVFVSNGVDTRNLLETTDLADHEVGVTTGSYEAEYLRQHYPRLRLRSFDNNQRLVQAAAKGEVMAFAADYPVGMFYLDRFTTPDRFRVLSVLYQQNIYAAVPKGQAALLARVNQALSRITPEERTAITQKWMHSAVGTEQSSVWDYRVFLLGVLLSAFFGLIWHNKVLNRRLANFSRELLAQEQHILLLTQNMSDWVWAIDRKNHFSYVSPSVKKLLGYEVDELVGQPLQIILSPAENERVDALNAHLAATARRGEIRDYKDIVQEFALLHKQGYVVWVEAAMRIFYDPNGRYISSQGNSRDITERKQAEDAMRQLTFNDPLTQLPNRRLLSDRLKQAMAGCSRHHQYCALLFLDLDNFKYINDNHGHDNGDYLLQQVAHRLMASLRENDTLARFGGDEFAVVAEFLGKELSEAKQHALRIAIKILETFDQDFRLRDNNCHLTASIGIILFNNDQKSVDGLIKQADTAMYQAKSQGRNQFFIADP